MTSGGRRLAVHAWASGLLSLLLLLIWALSGGAYFWPVWVILPLATALAVHVWVRLLRVRPELWQRPRVSHGLAMHAGVWACLSLYLTGIGLASASSEFWPVWPILGLAVPLAIHATAVFLRAPSEQALNERIEVLTSTRRGALDVQETQLRSIERDLHDGTQARLVALGMSLGMAEQKLADAEPGAAREYLAEARVSAEQALRELRDLARGIHPPLLTDRGLEAAVRSLADTLPLRVELDVRLNEHLAPALESAAYFVAAEGLANATKHAHATRVSIHVVQRERTLALEIEDDGVGGADPQGNGLAGLRQRVQALDGTLHVRSPAGGPTVLSARLPCGS